MVPCQTQLFAQTEAVSMNKKVASEFALALVATPPTPKKVVYEQIKRSITLDSILPTEQEENKLQRARRILGDLATDIPDDVLEVHLVKFQYLVDCWLDSFEKQAFSGKTLKTLNQLLREE